MKMKESLQTIFDEYCGVDVYKVNDFTKEQLKESIRDYLLDKGLENIEVFIAFSINNKVFFEVVEIV